MSDSRNKKPKVFIKKNREVNTNKSDDFYEYDKVKSRVDTVNEDFFENLESVDYTEVKLRKEQEEIEQLKIKEEKNTDFVEGVSQDTVIEDEVIQDSKNIIEEDDDFGSVNDLEDDFGAVDDFSKDKNLEELPFAKEEVITQPEDSIFEKFDFVQNDIEKENNTDNYSTLFENDEFENKNNEEDSFGATGIIQKINSNDKTETSLYATFEDDDDFGSIESFEDEMYTEESNFKKDGYINVSQKANYYKDDDFENYDDEYYIDKKGRRRKRKSKIGSFFRFLFLALIALGAMAVYFGLTHDLFKIDYIQITGNVINEKEILSAKAGVGIGDNIFLSRASKIEKNLKEISTIESVKVTKNYPNIILIEVKENYVSSYINASGGITTIDNYGKVKSTGSENNGLTGIQLKGLTETNFKVGEAFSKDVSKVNLILELLTKSYYNNIAVIDFSINDNITFELKNSIKVTFGDLKDYSKKLKVLDVLIKKIQTDGIGASEIILNVGENPIIVKK